MQLFKPTGLKRTLFFLIGDIVLSIFSIILAYLLRFKFEIPQSFYSSIFTTFSILIPLKIVILAFFRQYSITWRFYSFVDAKNLFKAHLIIYFIFGSVGFLGFKYFYIPKSIAIIDFFFSFVMLGGFRFFKRLLIENNYNEKKAIFIGANTKTQNIIKRCLNGELNYYPLAIYDDVDSETYISNIKVYNIDKLDNLDATTAIITKHVSQKELDVLVDRLNEIGVVDIKIANDFENTIKNISIEDLLARKPKDLDKKAIEDFVKNKKILITGAGGSIGSEICRLCEKYGAKELVLVDNGEFNLYSINEELNIKRKPYLMDVAKYDEIKKIFEKEKPEIVIHAAAYKHVPLCEENHKSAVVNNIIGTKNVIDLAVENGVKNFILISTDKAVRPTNVMGATKRVCELYAQNIKSKNTKIAAVRFGNVLGSSGSVVPKFKKLIEEGKPLTVTHPEITRYFMLIPEACQLVLQAGSLAQNGEIFILDMGEPVKIADLARKMLKLYGKDENNIIYTGLRPGEKLYEELLINEAEKQTKYESIFVAAPTQMDINTLQKEIEELSKLSKKESIIKKLKEIVKEYKPSSL